jgi:hypothetical protein
MKIYFDPPDEINAMEEALETLTKDVTPEIAQVFEPIKTIANDLYSKKSICSRELIKYKIMWALRFLESEIESENGSFRITNDGDLAIRDFSTELTEKIKQEIKERFKK